MAAAPETLSCGTALRRFLGTLPLISCSWRVTRACTARCGYCYSSSAEAYPDELDRAEALRVATELADAGLLRLFLTGGEPTLCRHLPEIVETAARRGVRVALSTHGGKLPDRALGRLADAGLRQLQVSLDAVGPAHDAIRGIPGLWDKAIDLVRRASVRMSADADVIVATVVTAGNLGELPAIARAAAEAGARRFVLVPLTVTGRASCDLMLGMPAFLDQIAALRAEAIELGVEIAPLVPPALSGDTGGYVRAYPYEIAIDAQGQVAACDLFLNDPARIVGSVRHDRIAELYERVVAQETASIVTEQAQMRGVCAQCHQWPVCGGGNRALVAADRNPNTASDPHCDQAFRTGCFPARELVALDCDGRLAHTP